MSVLSYIDTSYFSPAYDNTLPVIASPNIDAICKEIFMAVKMKEPIFVYGDYDMDGFCAAMIWDEILRSLSPAPVHHYTYISRRHTLDPDIIRQVEKTKARVVIICDTGSSLDDRVVLSLLRSRGYVPVVIDHHVWEGCYEQDKEEFLVYNSYEERNLLEGNEISGAYSSLLVACRLCTKYFQRAVLFNAMVYALASMYSDVVDLASPPGRALYNCVQVLGRGGPVLFQYFNKYGYSLNRMFFSYHVNPKINACFRSENYGLINRCFIVQDKIGIEETARLMGEIHLDSRKLVEAFVPLFHRERFGNFVLCTHTMTEDTEMLRIRNYSGLIANKIAKEEMGAAIVLVKVGKGYEGSFRDYYNRNLLETFQLFSDVGGHDAAFGLEVANLNEFRRHLRTLSDTTESMMKKDYVPLSSSVVSSADDVLMMALYNEYMNVRPRLYISHRPSHVRRVSSTRYYKYFDLGLPALVKSDHPILEGDNILIEPRRTKDIELWCIE